MHKVIEQAHNGRGFKWIEKNHFLVTDKGVQLVGNIVCIAGIEEVLTIYVTKHANSAIAWYVTILQHGGWDVWLRFLKDANTPPAIGWCNKQDIHAWLEQKAL